MELVILQEHLDAVRRAGACGDGLRKYRVGTPVHEIDRAHLQWVETKLPDLAESISSLASQVLLRGKIALSMLGDGDGYGDGYGYGYGYGYGDGDGYGYGDGDGDGYGDGYGDGGSRLDVVPSS